MTENKPSAKLTRREPTDPMEDAIEEAFDRIRGWEYEAQVLGTAPWRAGFDASPNEATEALRQHLHTVRAVLNGNALLNDLGGSYDAFVATPEGRALMGEDDGDVS